MFKKLGILIVILVSFGSGYYLGSTRLAEISNSLNDLKKNMKEKTSTLETEVKRLRLRMSLVDVRSHVMNSMEEIEKKNFGNAKKELEEAGKKMDHAHDLAGNDLKPRLNLIKGRLKEIQSSGPGIQPRSVLQLRDIKIEMDRMIEG